MGFYYRRSFSAGPFRVNLSRSGVGYSVGGRGFRTGISSRGRRYTNLSLPGTGFGYRVGRRSGCAVVLLAAAGFLAAAGVGGAHALAGITHLFARWGIFA
ncbi:MAG: DUF4236 domain-containing protein [Phycisphaerales bacterium]|jgi:hypothetical protein|nr:DUF4236 domain-containing protein [Phycisphaerales bacterium]